MYQFSQYLVLPKVLSHAPTKGEGYFMSISYTINNKILHPNTWVVL